MSFTINVQIGATPELEALLSKILESLPTSQQASAPSAVTQEAALPVAEPEPARAETPAEAKEYTAADVRAAIADARTRIEGEGWEENRESEGVKQYHKPLTAKFKELARGCGADKPSALPDSASRARFIELCSMLDVYEGEIVTDFPGPLNN